jgi:cell division protein FtsI (penicillin-binding protein 3)
VKGYPWSGGTGRRAQLPSYIVAGKTGTAQIPINGRYSQTDYNASFVGIYPATKPQITILVTIERPKGARHTGGNVAAPIFASVAEEVGNYLYLPADKVLEDKK